jgi:hypothetical protein
MSNKHEREGGETSVINNDKGVADKTMMMGVVTIGRDAVEVASARGTTV